MRTVCVVTNSTPDRRTAEHSSLTASQRAQRARIAAQARWLREDGSQGTHAAREAFMARFEREVDPDGTMHPDERERRAASARRLYFQRLAFAKSRKAAERRGEPVLPERAQVVYFLRRGGMVKIGTTTDLPRRVKAFQHTLADVVGVVPGGYPVERAWHQRFNHLRVSAAASGGTEWFTAADELLAAIASATAAAGTG